MEELQILKECIDDALDECQRIILENPNIVLSEGDLEKLLCCCIHNKIHKKTEYSVHCQISNYPCTNRSLNARFDIVLLKEAYLQPNASLRKGQTYDTNEHESFVIELKYVRKGDSMSKVYDDLVDIKKCGENTWLYVVVLFDSDTNQSKKNKLITQASEYEEYDKRLFCHTLIKS